MPGLRTSQSIVSWRATRQGLVLASLVAILLSCAGNPLNIRQIAVTENPTEQIGLLESRIGEARQARLDLKSPEWFGSAEDSYQEARKLRDDGDPIQKIMADEHGQHVMELAKDLIGAEGLIAGSGPAGTVPAAMQGGATEVNFEHDMVPGVDRIWHYGFLFSPALTLGGGTFAVQRNIVAEMVLGLPREPNVEKGMTWLETRAR